MARVRVEANRWVPVNVWRMNEHLQALGIYGEPDIRRALLDALSEIEPKHYRGEFPPEVSYEPVCKDAPLFAFAWQSESRACQMYLKFCFLDDQVFIVSFHQQRERAKS